MGQEIIPMIVIPIAFFGMINVIFQEPIGVSLTGFRENLACPMPSITGLWNSSGTIVYLNATYNYPDVSNQTLTLTCSQVHTLNGFNYAYGSPTIPIAGVPFFLGDFISVAFEKLGSTLVLAFSWLVFPAFIDGLTFMIWINIPLFAFLGFGIYRAVNPFG